MTHGLALQIIAPNNLYKPEKNEPLQPYKIPPYQELTRADRQNDKENCLPLLWDKSVYLIYVTR